MDKTIGKVVKQVMGDGEKKRPVKSIKLKVKFQRNSKRKRDNDSGHIYSAPRSSKKKRSSVPPKTAADKKLSIAHLKDSINYNKRHIRDHRAIESKGGSKEYNEDHIKHHQKAMEKDVKLLEDRKKAARKLRRGMTGYRK